MKFEMEAIPVGLGKKKIDANQEMQNVMNGIGRTANGDALYMLKLFHRTTATWRHQPAFHFKTNRSSDGIEITIWTDDDVYRYVDKGTDVRYMHMSDDFVPKTQPDVIGSFRGSGGATYLGAPLPGIQARGFTDKIYAMRAPAVYLHVQDRFDRETKAMFERMIL